MPELEVQVDGQTLTGAVIRLELGSFVALVLRDIQEPIHRCIVNIDRPDQSRMISAASLEYRNVQPPHLPLGVFSPDIEGQYSVTMLMWSGPRGYSDTSRVLFEVYRPSSYLEDSPEPSTEGLIDTSTIDLAPAFVPRSSTMTFLLETQQAQGDFVNIGGADFIVLGSERSRQGYLTTVTSGYPPQAPDTPITTTVGGQATVWSNYTSTTTTRAAVISDAEEGESPSNGDLPFVPWYDHLRSDWL